VRFPHAAKRWLGEHWLVLALGLVASLPILTSTIRAVGDGWTPVLDDAIVALRSFDVFTTHTPFVGDYSNVSQLGVGTVFSPGPLLFWLLAIPARAFGDWALPVTMGLVNTACVIGVVGLARRRGGDVFMFATAAVLPLMCLSVPQEALHDILNPWSALLPATLMVFLGWSVACGEYRLVPISVLVFSFVAQSHLSLAWPTLVTALVSIGGLSWRLLGRGAGPARRAASAPWLLAALAIGLFCWGLPLLDQATHQPGNLTRILDAATSAQRTLPLAQGWHALVGAIGIWPWWLRPSPTGFDRAQDAAKDPSVFSAVTCVMILAALTIVAARAHRVRSDLRVGAALAVLLGATIVLVTSSTPAKLGYDLQKGLLWTSPVGMFAWLMFGWSVAAVARSYVAPSRHRLKDFAAPARIAGLAAVTVIAGVAAAKLHGSDSNARWYQPTRTIVARVVPRLSHKGVIFVDARGDVNSFTVQTGLFYQLRARGYRVVTLNGYLALVHKLGSQYDACRSLPGRTLRVADDGRPLRPGALLLASVPMPPNPVPGGPQAPGPMRVFVVKDPATSVLTNCAQSPTAALTTRSTRGLRALRLRHSYGVGATAQ
jgi:hypothetical protein